MAWHRPRGDLVRILSFAFCLACALCARLVAHDAPPAAPSPSAAAIGVDDAMLAPAFWIAQVRDPDRVLLAPTEIAALNARILRDDPSMHDLRALPAMLSASQVRGWIQARSARPTRTLYDAQGRPVPAATLDALHDALALAAIAAETPTRYGLIVRRAALRTFPTELRVFSRPGDADIDRFQETAEYPGTPVVIAHASRDGPWLFVVSPRYAAWTRRENVAAGSAAQVFGYLDRPYRVITGAKAHTVYTPERPELSQLELDMGTRVPRLDWPSGQPVNGQGAEAAYVLQLPYRQADGTLAFAPALLPKVADSADAQLPLTPANLIRQAFKFLGERYGWGNDYDGRDCSGFVADVYRSLGVELPRNTGDQAASPALAHRAFTAADDHAARMRAIAALRTGDLVYIPGHVMMVLGWYRGAPYVIHDTAGIVYRDGAALRARKLNAVAVTPLLSLSFADGSAYVDRITSIVHIGH